MNIQQSNSRELKIITPLSGALFAFAFCAFLSLLGAFFVGDGWLLTCQRETSNEGQCKLSNTQLYQSERESLLFELSTLVAKVVKSDERDKSGEYCYLPAIVLTQNNTFSVFKLLPSPCSEYEAHRIVSEINHFISTLTEKRLNIRGINWTEILLVSSPFLLFGLLMFILVAQDGFSSCVFDLDKNCFTIFRKKWFRIIEIEEYSLDEIEVIELEAYDNGMSIEDKIIVKLTFGKEIVLPRGSYSNRRLIFNLKHFLDLR